MDDDGTPVLGPDGAPVLVRIDDLPASERFFTGGDTTVRGFGLDQLGTEETLDPNGFPERRERGAGAERGVARAALA